MSTKNQVDLPDQGFLRSSAWWHLFRRSMGLALMGALGALVYVKVIAIGTDLVWADDTVSPDLFSGSLTILAIMSGAGLLVGLIHRFIPRSGAPNVFEGMDKGKIEYGPVPGGLLISVVSLIGGYSLGPEVPTGMLAGGSATALGERAKWDDSTKKVTFDAAVGGAYGGLFTSPFVMTLMLLELTPPQRLKYFSYLTIQVFAALTGFAVFFAIGGFSELLSELSLPSYNLKVWHFGIAMVIGGIGVACGMLTTRLWAIFGRLAAPLASRVVLRGLLAGITLGLLGMAVPLTLYSGGSTLPVAISPSAGLAVGVLIVSALAKIVAMTAAQSFGFIGGPIFPLVFAGGVLGAAINGAFPDIPLALAVTAGMAALPAAVLPLPLSMGMLAIVIAGTSLELGAPVLTASVTASALAHGLKRLS